MRSNVNKNIIDFISRALCVGTVKSMSRRARFFFSITVPMQTLSSKTIKVGAALHPRSPCSLAELIYDCVYCRPPSSLFMLRQKKRQRSREVLRTVFVCHRVPFLIPQAPAMPAGAARGGGSRRKARLRRFSCCSQSGVGGWVPRRPVSVLKSRTPARQRASGGLFLRERKLLTIICYLNLCKRED